MSIKQVVTIQYQQIMDRTAKTVHGISVPPEGWLCTARKALNMSGAQLARRLGGSTGGCETPANWHTLFIQPFSSIHAAGQLILLGTV